MPYTAEQLKRIEEYESKKALEQQLFTKEKEEASPEEKGLWEIFAKSRLKGIAGRKMSFGQTRQKIAEARGKEEKAAEEETAVEEQREIAEEEVYRAKYGEEGLQQFKNLTDPDWWASTLGEAIPGSVPFLGGAAAGALAGGTAGAFVGGVGAVPGAIVGGMLGGGATVFAQEFGSAYYEYLEANPDDKEGAENYALKKSGISGIINALTVPLALVGKGIEPFKRSIIQAVLQAGAETGDTVSGNLLVREYIDPNLDISTGVARGIAGELAFESPALASIVRGRHSVAASKQEREKAFREGEEKTEALLEMTSTAQALGAVLAAEGKKEGAVDYNFAQRAATRDQLINEIKEGKSLSLPTDQLKLAAERIGVRLLPGDDAMTMFNKIKRKLRADAEGDIAHVKLQDDLLSELTFEDRFREQSEIFNNMSGQEMFDYVQKEFAGTDPEITWGNYGFWANNQGEYSFEPPAIGSEFYTNPDMPGAWGDARKALAHASASILQRAQTSGPIQSSLEGRGGFKNYIENLSAKYTKNDLERAVQEVMKKHFPVKKMNKSQLSAVLAEQMMVLENLRMKKQMMIRSETISAEETVGEEEGKRGIKISTHTLRELSSEGNAVQARADLFNEDGTGAGEIFFQRELLKDKSFNDLIHRAAKGAELEIDALTPEEVGQVGKLGKLVATSRGGALTPKNFEQKYKGKTIDELVIDPMTKIEGAELMSMKLVGSTRPVDQRSFFTKSKGKVSSLFRPMGKMGLLTTTKQKATEARLRTHNRTAKEMAMNMEKAIIKAAIAEVPKKFGIWKTKKYLEAEQKIRNKVRSFLKKTGAYIELSKDEKAAIQEEITRLEAERSQALVSPDSTGIATEYEQGIQDLYDLLGGNVRTEIAVQELPTKRLRKVAQESRKGIDVLSERILNEFPPEMLGDEKGEPGYTRQILENQLGSYMVSSFAMFEPKLGFNPRFNKTFLRSPTAKRLYKNAVIAVVQMNINDPKFSTNDAINVVDDIVSQTYFSSAADTATLPGVLKVRDAAQTGKLPSGPKLLQERFKIPFAIRRLMGEITDPTLMVATSFSRIAKLIETQNFYRDLLRINNMPGEMMFSQRKAGPFQTEIDPKDAFNPLAGLYTTKDIATELSMSTLSEANKWSALINIYQNTFLRAKAGVQGMMIVLSTGTQSRNAFGAALMFTGAGHLIQGDWAVTIRAIREELLPGLSYNKDGSIKGDQEAARRTLRDVGLLGVSSTSPALNDAFGIFNELASGKYDSTEKIIHALYSLKHLNTESKVTTALTLPGYVIDKTVGSVYRFLKGTYAAVDDFFKILTFGANRIEIKKSLDRMSEAAVANGAPPLSDEIKLKILRDYTSTLTTNVGTYRSNAAVLYRHVTDLDSYISHLSAHITRNTIPNYDYVGAFAKFWRQLPLGSFIAFPTEMVRVSGNLVNMQYKDATYSVPEELMLEAGLPPEQVMWNAKKNAEGQWVPTKPYIKQIAQRPFHRMAMKRLLLGGGTIVGLPIAAVTLGQLAYDVDDEDLIAADEIGPEYAENTTRVPSSKVREDGSGFSFFNLDWMHPFMYLWRGYNAVASNVRDREEHGIDLPEAVTRGLFEGVVQFAEDYYQVSIAAQVIDELVRNETPTGKQIYNPSDNWGEKLVVGFNYALDNAGPGGYRQVRDVAKAFSEGDERFTKSGKIVDEVDALLKLGGITQSDADPNSSLGFYIQKVKDLHTDRVAFNMNPMRWQAGKFTEEQILRQWQDSQEIWFAVQKNMYFKLQAYKKLKVSKKIYRTQTQRLGQIAGVDANIIRNIERGIFTPWDLPPSYEKNFNQKKRELGLQRTWPRAEIRAQYLQLKRARINLLGNPYLPLPWEED